MSEMKLFAIVMFDGVVLGFTMMPRAPDVPAAFVLDMPWIRFPDTVTPVTPVPRKMPEIEAAPPDDAALEVTLEIVLPLIVPPLTDWFCTIPPAAPLTL